LKIFCSINTGLTTKIGTVSTASSTASPIDLITWNEDIKRMVMRKRNADNTYINYNVPSIITAISDISSLITINNSNFTLVAGLFTLYGHVAQLTIQGRFTSSVPHDSLIMSCNRPIYEPSTVIRCSSRDESNHVATLDMRNDDKIYTWGQAQANPSALYIFNFTYLVGNVGGI